MDELEFFASLVQSLAWPAATVTLAIVLRDGLRTLFEGISKRIETGNIRVEGTGWKAFVSESLDEAAEAAAEFDPGNQEGPAEPSRPHADPENVYPELEMLATKDPRGAILEAWNRVELALYQLSQKHNIGAPDVPAHYLVLKLRSGSIIDEDTGTAISRLLDVRNFVAPPARSFVPPGDISRREALDYLATAQRVLNRLRHI